MLTLFIFVPSHSRMRFTITIWKFWNWLRSRTQIEGSLLLYRRTIRNFTIIWVWRRLYSTLLKLWIRWRSLFKESNHISSQVGWQKENFNFQSIFKFLYFLVILKQQKFSRLNLEPNVCSNWQMFLFQLAHTTSTAQLSLFSSWQSWLPIICISTLGFSKLMTNLMEGVMHLLMFNQSKP